MGLLTDFVNGILVMTVILLSLSIVTCLVQAYTWLIPFFLLILLIPGSIIAHEFQRFMNKKQRAARLDRLKQILIASYGVCFACWAFDVALTSRNKCDGHCVRVESFRLALGGGRCSDILRSCTCLHIFSLIQNEAKTFNTGSFDSNHPFSLHWLHEFHRSWAKFLSDLGLSCAAFIGDICLPVLYCSGC